MEKKILFVDDEKSILKILEALFRAGGYVPRCILDAEEALVVLKDENIKVCFVDIHMPIMNGMELCRRIKEVQPDAHVYALSAFPGVMNDAQYKNFGFNGYLRKPFNIDQLMDVGRTAFESLSAKVDT
ncbi:MAG: response regulator [bacterium]